MTCEEFNEFYKIADGMDTICIVNPFNDTRGICIVQPFNDTWDIYNHNPIPSFMNDMNVVKFKTIGRAFNVHIDFKNEEQYIKMVSILKSQFELDSYNEELTHILTVYDLNEKFVNKLTGTNDKNTKIAYDKLVNNLNAEILKYIKSRYESVPEYINKYVDLINNIPILTTFEDLSKRKCELENKINDLQTTITSMKSSFIVSTTN